MRYSFVWDHWVYLPALGILALVAALVVRAGEVLRVLAVVYGFAAIVLPVFALLTWRQAGTFTDEETLWRDTLARNPDCWMAHSNLGLYFYSEGRNKEAAEHSRLAIQINPNCFDAINNLGLVLAAQGRSDEAIENFRRAIRINPDFHVALNNLGAALAAQGRFDGAIKNYRAALRINPYYYESLNNLGIALTARGRPDEAIGYFQQAGRADPHHADIHLNWGIALDQLGRTREAVDQYREALKLNFDLIAALNNLAWVLASNPDENLRNGPEAVRLAEHACELNHYHEPLFIGTLAAAYAEAGRFPEAVATAEKAERIATAAGLTAVAAKNRHLLELYRSGKPYHELVPAEQ
jgi:tetratricopeptide (TPR) repeat protein